MAFAFTALGPLVQSDPEKAAGELAKLLRAKGNNLSAVVADLGVDYRTATRWLTKLQAAGFDVRAMAKEEEPEGDQVPRGGPSGRAKRRPAASP